MSFEGYDLYVCPEGHRWSRDVYSPSQEDCPYCGKRFAWSCVIDQTNCDEKEPELELVEQPPTCPTCGQCTGPARYKVPGPEVRAVYIGEDNDGDD